MATQEEVRIETAMPMFEKNNFQEVTRYILVDIYKSFERLYCLHLHGCHFKEEANKFLRGGKFLLNYTMSYIILH
jgi:hypothetical protein